MVVFVSTERNGNRKMPSSKMPKAAPWRYSLPVIQYGWKRWPPPSDREKVLVDEDCWCIEKGRESKAGACEKGFRGCIKL